MMWQGRTVDIPVHGLIYDVKTGRLHQVV